MSFHGYDAWRCAAPDDCYPEYDPNEEPDDMKPDDMSDENETFQAILTYVRSADARELRMLRSAVDTASSNRKRELESELKELRREKVRVPRSDKGKPRTSKTLTVDADPFEVAR